MKIIAVVPIKLNNRRLPNKNIKAFANGQPLCHYILTTLRQIEQIDEVYVYCSSPSIQEYIPKGIKYLKRSKTLDLDTTKINEVLYEFALTVDADIYVMAHTTAPFIKGKSIREGLDAVLSGRYDSAFSAAKLQTFLWNEGRPFNYKLNEIPRTQDLPPVYEETSGFYIYTKEVIFSANRRIGNCPKIIQVGKIEGIDIDEEEDFRMADAIYNYGLRDFSGGGISIFLLTKCCNNMYYTKDFIQEV